MPHGLLKAEGLVLNRKRAYRVDSEEGLQVWAKKRRILQRARQPIEVPTRFNGCWSVDVLYRPSSSGRCFRVLNVLDECSREVSGMLAISISVRSAARFQDQLQELRAWIRDEDLRASLRAKVEHPMLDHKIAVCFRESQLT